MVEIKNEQKKSEIIVVKGSSTIVQDLFAGELARILNIHVPEERMVAYNDGMEWSTIKTVMKRVAPELESSITKELNRAFFVVMEYIPGIALNDSESVKSIFQSSNVKKQNILKDIGSIIAFDVLINNWDRIPSGIWNNEGNSGNIILQSGKWNEDGVRAVAIDNSITCISSNLNGNYLNRVRNFMGDLNREEWEASNSNTVNNIVQYLESCTGYYFSYDDRRHIVSGLSHGIESIRNNIDENTFHSVYEKIKNLIRGDWGNVWSDGLARIDIPFLIQVLNIINYKN